MIASGQANNYIFDQMRSATDAVNGQTFGRIDMVKALGEVVTPSPTPTPDQPLLLNLHPLRHRCIRRRQT